MERYPSHQNGHTGNKEETIPANTGKYITVAIEEEDKTIIGFMREHDTDPRPEIQITKISPRGFPIKTGKKIKAHRASIRNVAKWKGGIMGITEYNYPNPKEWTLGNTPGRKQLDKITVKDITIALKEHQEPRCKKKCQQRLRIKIPWRQISGNLVHGIGTKKDTGPWVKNILQRNMRLI